MSDLVVDVTYTVRVPMSAKERAAYLDGDEYESMEVSDALIGRAQTAIAAAINGLASDVKVSTLIEVEML